MECRVSSTHPFKDEENEGKHHGTVRAVVQLLVLLGLVKVVGPRGPGSKHHDGAPDEKNKLHEHPAPVRNCKDFLHAILAAASHQEAHKNQEGYEVQSEGNISK